LETQEYLAGAGGNKLGKIEAFKVYNIYPIYGEGICLTCKPLMLLFLPDIFPPTPTNCNWISEDVQSIFMGPGLCSPMSLFFLCGRGCVVLQYSFVGGRVLQVNLEVKGGCLKCYI